MRASLSETTAEILPSSRYVKAGGSIRLSCRVYLGERGPDAEYRESAVVHWFHGQRLLDPAVDGGGAGGRRSGSRSARGMINLYIHIAPVL